MNLSTNPHIATITTQVVDGDNISDDDISEIIAAILDATHIEGWCTYDSVVIQVERETHVSSWAQKFNTNTTIPNQDNLYGQPPVEVYE